jgi:hypothetical protein
MEPQIFEFILTELKHKIAWKSKDIPLYGSNRLLRRQGDKGVTSPNVNKSLVVTPTFQWLPTSHKTPFLPMPTAGRGRQTCRVSESSLTHSKAYPTVKRKA